MRKLLVWGIAPLLFIFASCASFEAKDVSTLQQKIFALQADYNVALAAAVRYESLPRCNETQETLCSDRDIVERMRAADNTAWAALSEAQELAREDDASAFKLENAYKVAQPAVKTFANLLDAFDIGE